MAGDWIKMRVHLDADPAVIFMADCLDTSVFEVVGLLHWLWSWADQHTEDGFIKGVSTSYINNRRAGFGDCLLEAGWLELVDGGIRLPHFEVHNGKSGKKRAQTKNRQQTFRNAESVTKALPEKKRKEKSKKKEISLQAVLSDPEFKSLQGAEFASLWDEWMEYRKERGFPMYVERSLKAILRKAMEVGYAQFKEAVNTAIANGWQGVFPRGSTRTKQTNQERSQSRGDYPEAGGRGPEIA